MAINSTNSPTDVRVKQSSASHYVNSPFIRVLVGKDPEVHGYFVHGDLICARSDFFAKAMNDRWKEAKDRTVPLPDDESEIFSLYLRLLYASNITPTISHHADCLQTNELPVKPSGSGVDNKDATHDAYTSLSKLYVLAEKLIDNTTKELVLAAISAHAREMLSQDLICIPPIESIQMIYEGTPEGSPVRRLITQIFTDNGCPSSLTTEADDIPKDFLYELSISLISTRPIKQRNTFNDERAVMSFGS
ncbi:hypothetical protein N0V94_002695 [Neodidymelliopsis sp. IMI 364377]|nr:hypothetical protein N0V94_002695 [Neodidymelliopsis sp. IMI 364377]